MFFSLRIDGHIFFLKWRMVMVSFGDTRLIEPENVCPSVDVPACRDRVHSQENGIWIILFVVGKNSMYVFCDGAQSTPVKILGFGGPFSK